MLLGEASADFNWVVLAPVVTGFLALMYLLPTPRRRSLTNLVLAVIVALLGFGTFLFHGFADRMPISSESLLFVGFSLTAVAFAMMMVAQRNPARAALFFAVVVLSTCGLFLLLAAPFLMAATIIIYAGAIIVTFLFVIMLAQQRGMTDANDRSREPSLAAAVGFIILGTLLVVLQRVYATDEVDSLIAKSDRYASAEKLDPELKDPAKARAFLDGVVRARERLRLGTGRPPIPPLDGIEDSSDRDKNPVVEVEQMLDLVEGLPPAGGSQANDPVVNMPEFRREMRRIHHELSYLKAVREGRLPLPTPASEDEAENAKKAVVLSPHSQAWDPNHEDDPSKVGMRRLPDANIAAIGRSLFTDHLIAVELGGTLLLVATIGAIAIAGRRRGEENA